MLIDCDTCTAGPRACGDCIVTHLLSVAGPRDRGTADHDPPAPADLTPDEVVAVEVLAAGGLVPPLRLVTECPGNPRIGCLESGDRPQRSPEGLGTGARAG